MSLFSKIRCMEQGVVTLCDCCTSCCITVVVWKWRRGGRAVTELELLFRYQDRKSGATYLQLPVLRHYGTLSGRPLESRFQCPRIIRRGSAAARLMGLRVRIPPRPWMYESCKCYVLSGRGLCFWLITRPEKT
jgi:hypothetical protein